MLAIHNCSSSSTTSCLVANAFAKLSKCQQFTTLYYIIYFFRQLQTLLQSYQNVSNSQLLCSLLFLCSSCKRFCKVIKMLAIHNTSYSSPKRVIVANAFAKLSKCQQFTTFKDFSQFISELQTLLQSYQNVSNSQLKIGYYYTIMCCKRFCKVIKMLAIHNDPFAGSAATGLQTLLQSYQNVSNSQQCWMNGWQEYCCKRFCKVIKMLAIHNQPQKQAIIVDVANAFAKLSKCQQFTTPHIFCAQPYLLQTLLQSYQNVSNSQLSLVALFLCICCKRFCKVIKMLAIHNPIWALVLMSIVANAFAKLSKCQQFTTLIVSYYFFLVLQTLLQSYQNVSNSQLNHNQQPS